MSTKCSWNEVTRSYAAENGHVECATYAIKNGRKSNKSFVKGNTIIKRLFSLHYLAIEYFYLFITMYNNQGSDFITLKITEICALI